MPDELKNLTCIEELLITRAHVVSRIVRLQARNQASQFAVKGHVILLPQDITELRRPLSDELLAELAWEDEMAEKIKRLYGV